MAKASGGTRTKYPNNNKSSNSTTVGEMKYSRIYSFVPNAERRGTEKLTDEDFDQLNAQITKVLKDAGISMKNAQIFVNDYGNSFDIVSDMLHISREIYPNDEMHHSYFKIEDKNAREKGVSKAIHRALMPLYEKMGIKTISVDAALENGGHTWAQYGFRVSKQQAQEVIWQIQVGGPPMRKRAQAILDEYYSKHSDKEKFPMYLFSRDEWVGGQGYNFKPLAGTMWSGTIDLTDKQQRKDLYDYIGYKGKKG